MAQLGGEWLSSFLRNNGARCTVENQVLIEYKDQAEALGEERKHRREQISDLRWQVAFCDCCS